MNTIRTTPQLALALAQKIQLYQEGPVRRARAIAWAVYRAACAVEDMVQPPHRPAYRPCIEYDRYASRTAALRAGESGKPIRVHLNRGGTARAIGVPGEDGSCVEITLHPEDYNTLAAAIATVGGD